MKKSHKKTLGFLGIGLVATTTVYAATLPAPDATAVSTMSDTITVRVVSASPEVNLISPTDGDTRISPTTNVRFTHSFLQGADVSLIRNNPDGTTEDLGIIFSLPESDPEGGTFDDNIDMRDYGYGDFTLRVEAVGHNGEPEVSAVNFAFIPVDGGVSEEEDGTVSADLAHWENSADHFKIVVTREGEDEPLFISDDIEPGTEGDEQDPEGMRRLHYEIPFDEFVEESGNYIITIISYDDEDEIIYAMNIGEHSVEIEEVPVPNTGAFFKNLGISGEDFATTSLIVFFILGIVAFGIVARGGLKKARRK